MEEKTAIHASESNVDDQDLSSVDVDGSSAHKSPSADVAGESSRDIAGSSLFPTNFLGIKHAYIGFLLVASFHPLIVMRDVGLSLAVYVGNSAFKTRWIENLHLRQNFFFDVGHSALILIEKLQLCHNDIRLPNIALKENSFCLLDFDLCSTNLPASSTESPLVCQVPMSLKDTDKYQKMMFTVGQIALVVFTIERGPTPKDLSDLTRYWLTNAKLKKNIYFTDLKNWAISKGRLVEGMFSESPLPLDTKIDEQYFLSLLHEILSLSGYKEVAAVRQSREGASKKSAR